METAIMSAAIAIVATMAAGGVQRNATKPATSEACSLLTKEDAAAALAEAVGAPNPAGNAEASACEYSGSGLHKINLNVMHLTPGTAAVYKSLCAQKGKEGLSGLGDTTCWYSEKHEELQVLKGMTFFSIEIKRSGDPTEAIKGAARKVFDRVR